MNSDLVGTAPAPTPNICSITVAILTAVRHIWGDLYLSFEWNHLMTKWSTGESFSGDNFMISTWYNFLTCSGQPSATRWSLAAVSPKERQHG